MSIIYADEVTKQAVENWADEHGLIAEDQLTMHLEERFGAHRVLVTSVAGQGDFLLLHLTTDQLAEPREFALLPDGSLSW